MCWTRYNLFPKNLLGSTRVTALNVRVPSFAPTVGAKMRFKNTWLKSPKKQLSFNIMIKINNESVWMPSALSTTESKYDEALVHSSGLSKHGTFLMWKITKMSKISLSLKNSASHLSLILYFRMSQWGFRFILNLILWCCDVSGCHSTGFTFPTPQVQE